MFMTLDHRPSPRSCQLLLPILMSLILTPKIAEADPFKEAQQRFSAYQERVITLQSHANTKYIVGELNTLNQWVAEAKRYLTDEDEDEFVRAVQLIRVQLRLVDVSLEELDAREQVLRLTEEAIRLEKKAKSEREGVVEIEKMMGGSLNSAPAQPSMIQAPPPAAIQQGAIR